MDTQRWTHVESGSLSRWLDGQVIDAHVEDDGERVSVYLEGLFWFRLSRTGALECVESDPYAVRWEGSPFEPMARQLVAESLQLVLGWNETGRRAT